MYIDCGTWYPRACNFLGLKYKLYLSLEKSLIERVIQYFDDGTENYNIKTVGNIIGEINFLPVDVLSADCAVEVQSDENRH